MRTFIANLAPVNVVGHPLDGHGRRRPTLLLRCAFDGQIGAPLDLPVYAGHETESVELGRLLDVTRVGPWFYGSVALDDDTEAMGIDSGQALSVGYSIEESFVDREGTEHVGRAVLEEVSVVDVGAFEGASLGTGYVPTEAQARENRAALASKGVLARDLIQIPGHEWVDADEAARIMARVAPIDFPGHTWVT